MVPHPKMERAIKTLKNISVIPRTSNYPTVVLALLVVLVLPVVLAAHLVDHAVHRVVGLYVAHRRLYRWWQHRPARQQLCLGRRLTFLWGLWCRLCPAAHHPAALVLVDFVCL